MYLVTVLVKDSQFPEQLNSTLGKTLTWWFYIDMRSRCIHHFDLILCVITHDSYSYTFIKHFYTIEVRIHSVIRQRIKCESPIALRFKQIEKSKCSIHFFSLFFSWEMKREAFSHVFVENSWSTNARLTAVPEYRKCPLFCFVAACSRDSWLTWPCVAGHTKRHAVWL